MIFLPHCMWAENNKNETLHAVQKAPAELQHSVQYNSEKNLLFFGRKKISELLEMAQEMKYYFCNFVANLSRIVFFVNLSI